MSTTTTIKLPKGNSHTNVKEDAEASRIFWGSFTVNNQSDRSGSESKKQSKKKKK